MFKFTKNGIGLALGFTLLAFLLPTHTLGASDMDVIGMSSVTVAPNILIVFDASGSMNEKDTTYLNGGSATRAQAAKEVIIQLVKANKGFKWGLFTFPWPQTSGTVQGGHLIAECKVREDDPNNSNDEFDKFIKQIENIYCYNGTPVASALAEAGLYFAGKNSFFWSSSNVAGDSSISVQPYQTPIDNECQANYIILLTDGSPSIDSGVKGGFTSTGITKYEMQSKNSILWTTNYMDGRQIGNYITNKRFDDDPDKRLGDLISDSRFVREDYWTAATNPDFIKGTLILYTTGYSSITWSKVESGSRALGHTGLGVNRQLYTTENANNSYTASQLIAQNRPYISGYNAQDPSRPFPRLTFTPSGANTLLNFAQQGYLPGTQVFQNNLTGDGNYGGDYLDDVAAFLHNEDLRLNWPAEPTNYPKQNVKVFTIGFMHNSDLLLRTAIQGGGTYTTASNAEQLKDALNSIVTTIKQELNMLSMPSIPSASGNETRAGNKVYMSYFKPQEGAWLGNLKSYTLDDKNTLNDYTENGEDDVKLIKKDSTSDWAKKLGVVNDGGDINSGGAAQMLARQISNNFNGSGRNVYTYLGVESALKHKDNGFKNDNSVNLKNIVDYSVAQNLTKFIEAVRGLAFGPIIHSSPVAIHYANNAGVAYTVVYVGANEGFLHAINAEDGSEKWVFILPEHLDDIHKAGKFWPTSGQYFVDGYLAAKKVEINSKDINLLVTGTRRGGHSYVGLDVTNPDEPAFAFEVGPDFEGKNRDKAVGFNLGLAWAKPTFSIVHSSMEDSGSTDSSDPCAIKVDKNYSGKHNIIILAGGYDERYDYATKPADVAPAAGAGITAVDLSSNRYDREKTFDKLNNTASPNAIKHSILMLAAADLNSDSMIDSLYFGDLGGYMFNAILYDIQSNGNCEGVVPAVKLVANDQFLPYIFFRASGDAPSEYRKIQYGADLVREYGNEYVYFGTDDRENPTDLDVLNRFYCVNNNDFSKYKTSTTASGYLTADDLYDVSLLPSPDDKDAVVSHLNDASNFKKGWYFDLAKGEKLVSTPLVVNGIVWFTTFTPNDDSVPIDPADKCVSGSSGGTALIYAVDYKSGTAAYFFDKDDEGNMQTDENGKVVNFSRSSYIGDTLSSEVGLTVHENGGMMISSGTMIGDQEGMAQYEVGTVTAPGVFYWRQIY